MSYAPPKNLKLFENVTDDKWKSYIESIQTAKNAVDGAIKGLHAQYAENKIEWVRGEDKANRKARHEIRHEALSKPTADLVASQKNLRLAIRDANVGDMIPKGIQQLCKLKYTRKQNMIHPQRGDYYSGDRGTWSATTARPAKNRNRIYPKRGDYWSGDRGNTKPMKDFFHVSAPYLEDDGLY